MKALSFNQVKEKTSLSRSHIWKLEHAGQFPKRFSISAREVRWIESEIDAWLANRAQAGDSRADKTA